MCMTVTEKELRRFVNASIRFDSIDLEKKIFTVKLSAKAEDAIEVEILSKILGRAGKGGVGGGIGGFFAVGGTGAGIGAVIGLVGGPIGVGIGTAIGAGIGAAVNAVAGAGGGAGVGAGVGYVLDKDSCTAQEIFPLLATDGSEKRSNDDGRMNCTVKFK